MSLAIETNAVDGEAVPQNAVDELAGPRVTQLHKPVEASDRDTGPIGRNCDAVHSIRLVTLRPLQIRLRPKKCA